MKTVLNIRKAIEALFPGIASWKQLDKHSFYHRGLCFLCQRSGKKKDVISFTKWKTVLCFSHKYSQTCLWWENLNLSRKQINKMSISASTNAFSGSWQPWDMLCLPVLFVVAMLLLYLAETWSLKLQDWVSCWFFLYSGSLCVHYRVNLD